MEAYYHEIVRRSCANELNTEIAPTDQMFLGNESHYFSCGASALECILCSLVMVGIKNPQKILDFGCGAGRVTRWLRAAFPHAEIHGTDIRDEDLQFVRGAFDAVTWVSGTDVNALKPLGLYDLIWVGSVFTHLSADVSASLFDKLIGWLAPKGVLVFSVHGRFVLHRASAGDNIYGLGNNWDELIRSYELTGFGYADYPAQTGYGISVSSSAWWIKFIEQHTQTRLAYLAERAWDAHHDVIAVQHTEWD